MTVPDAVETTEGQRILSLLDQRYVAGYDGRTVEKPLRSYAYVGGEVKLYRVIPEIVVTSIDQVTDGPPAQSG